MLVIGSTASISVVGLFLGPSKVYTKLQSYSSTYCIEYHIVLWLSCDTIGADKIVLVVR